MGPQTHISNNYLHSITTIGDLATTLAENYSGIRYFFGDYLPTISKTSEYLIRGGLYTIGAAGIIYAAIAKNRDLHTLDYKFIEPVAQAILKNIIKFTTTANLEALTIISAETKNYYPTYYYLSSATIGTFQIYYTNEQAKNLPDSYSYSINMISLINPLAVIHNSAKQLLNLLLETPSSCNLENFSSEENLFVNSTILEG